MDISKENSKETGSNGPNSGNGMAPIGEDFQLDLSTIPTNLQQQLGADAMSVSDFSFSVAGNSSNTFKEVKNKCMKDAKGRQGIYSGGSVRVNNRVFSWK